MKYEGLLVLTLALASCKADPEPAPREPVTEPVTEPTTEPTIEPAPEWIGVATMTSERTISLRLMAKMADGTRGEGLLTYAVGHADYDKVLQHLGGLEPGESKPVKPFPRSW